MKKLKMKEKSPSGLLITFCGLDGCGKTTLIRRLADELSSQFSVFEAREPTDFVRKSEIFRTYMDSEDHSAYEYRALSLMAAADRLQHVSHIIRPHLNRGQIVISDRYVYSCLANLRARGYCSDRWIYEIIENITAPDLSVFIDISVEEAISRVRSRPDERNSYIDTELQYRLRDEYIEICRATGGLSVSSETPIAETYAAIIEEVKKKIKEKKL